MSEQIKLTPVTETEEAPRPKAQFPTKMVRNIVVAAAAVAITGYVVTKVRQNSDEDEDANTEL